VSTLDWDQVSNEFVWDGSWRDVSVADTNARDWQAGMSALRRAGFSSRHDDDGSGSGTCELREPFSANHGTSVEFGANGVGLMCHFFDEHEIEFDLAPPLVAGQPQLDGVLAFMRSLAEAVGKPVLLSPENMHERPFIRVGPDGACEYISSAGCFVQLTQPSRTE
jgi:hypothetical protein